MKRRRSSSHWVQAVGHSLCSGVMAKATANQRNAKRAVARRASLSPSSSVPPEESTAAATAKLSAKAAASKEALREVQAFGFISRWSDRRWTAARSTNHVVDQTTGGRQRSALVSTWVAVTWVISTWVTGIGGLGG